MTAVAPGAGPRGVERFIAERTPDWAELVALLERSGGQAARLTRSEVLRLGELYRSAAADLARARQRWPGDPVVGELDGLVRRAREVVYRSPGARRSFTHWLTTGFFRRVRERPGLLLLAIALLWGPSLGMALWAHQDPATATRVADISALSRDAADSAGRGDGGRSTTASESASFSTQIFVNNIRVALLCLAGGVTGGIATAALLLYNGAVVGLVVGIFAASGAGATAVTYLAPHGVLEWSLVTLAGVAGLRVGAALVAPGLRPRGEVLVEESRAAAELALGVALWLVPTGLVEGFVTPRGLPPGTALAVGLAVGGAFWALVVWRGRPAPVTDGRPTWR